jgi:hypothetical protein
MAFASSSAATQSASSNNENWKAQGFLNFYLPAKNGQRRKLGAIPLKESKINEKQLLAWLNEDPSRVAQILSKLEIEYQSAAANDEHAFDLG